MFSVHVNQCTLLAKQGRWEERGEKQKAFPPSGNTEVGTLKVHSRRPSLLSERWPPPQKLNQQCQKWTHSQTPFSAVVDLNCLFRPALKARAHSREPREDRRNWIRSTKWNKTLYHRRCRGPNSYIRWLAETMCTVKYSLCSWTQLSAELGRAREQAKRTREGTWRLKGTHGLPKTDAFWHTGSREDIFSFLNLHKRHCFTIPPWFCRVLIL